MPSVTSYSLFIAIAHGTVVICTIIALTVLVAVGKASFSQVTDFYWASLGYGSFIAGGAVAHTLRTGANSK